MEKVYDYSDEKEITELLIGRTVTVEGDDTLVLDNGICLQVLPNEGCDGYDVGWYGIEELNEMPNAITDVQFEHEYIGGDYEPDQVYKIFVLGIDTRVKLLSVSGNDGNGYYGTGYQLCVKKI